MLVFDALVVAEPFLSKDNVIHAYPRGDSWSHREMSIGTWKTDTTMSKPWIQDPGSQPTSQLYVSGRLTQKSWSGGDGKSRSVQPTLSFNRWGGAVTDDGVAFRQYNAGKPGKKFLMPQSYNMTYSSLNVPRGTFYAQRYYVATGAQYDWYRWRDFTLFPSGGLPPVPVFPSSDTNDMINKLANSVKGSDFNMSVFLGEGSQTLRLIGDTAIAVAEALRMVALKRPFDAFRILAERSTMHGRRLRPLSKQTLRGRTPAQWWLELQYGWKPLLGDMKGAAEMLSHQLNQVHVTRKVVRKTLNFSSGSAPFSDRWPLPPESTMGTVIFPNAKASVSKQIIGYFTENTGLTAPVLSGVLDPELVAWELLPFSFVIDWALPIGDWLTARANASHLTGTFVTTITKRQESGQPNWSKNTFINGGLRTEIRDASYLYGYRNTLVTVERTVSGSLTSARPQLKTLNESLSVMHCLNGLALLTGLGESKWFRRSFES